MWKSCFQIEEYRSIIPPSNDGSINLLQCKYLNNIVEQDHRNVKRRIAINTGLKDFESAQRTLAGIEVVNIIRKNQIIDPKSTKYKTFYSLTAYWTLNVF